MQKLRKNRRPYRVTTLASKSKVDKSPATHAEKRLKERTGLSNQVLVNIRKRLKWDKLPPGHHHLPLQDKGYVVIKDVGKTKPHHVISTVLSRDMSPPGVNVEHLLKKKEAFTTPATVLAENIPESIPIGWRVLLDRKRRKKELRKYFLKNLPKDVSMPRDRKYLAEVLANPKKGLGSKTTPLSDLIMGRRLPGRALGL